MQLLLSVKDEEQMRSLAYSIAKAFEKERIFIALYGNMGAGKTTFVRGLGEFFGDDDVKSPTFVVMDEHADMLHIDAYRLEGVNELYDMGYEDYVGKKRITVVEWPERVKEILPSDRLEITITGQGEGERTVLIQAFGNAVSLLKEAQL